jgi:hypothetical protein
MPGIGRALNGRPATTDYRGIEAMVSKRSGLRGLLHRQGVFSDIDDSIWLSGPCVKFDHT